MTYIIAQNAELFEFPPNHHIVKELRSDFIEGKEFTEERLEIAG